MKDAFKVKKGLNVQPTDPAEVVNPEAGDIIVDSTDDNRLKVYDPTSSEFAAVGTGGSSGNILSDIEKLTPTVSNVVAVTDTTTFLPIDDNNKSVKATFSGSDGSIRYEGPASADLDGVQGVVKVWIKTDVEGLSLVATKDGVAQNNGLTVNSSNKWRQYEIPVVLGDADYGFEIQASGAVSGDVYIDEAFVTVEAVIRDLGAAQFVGSLHWNATTNCLWSSNSSTFTSFPDDPDCGNQARTIEGSGIADSSAGLRPEFQILNARTDGYYRVSFQGALYKAQTSNNNCRFRLTGQDNARTSVAVGASNGSVFSPTATFDIRFDTAGNKTINVQVSSQNNTDNCHIDGRPSNTKFTVHFYPDDTSTIVTQDTELTAKTANEFSATYQANTGNILRTNYDFIQSCTAQTSGRFTCTFNSGLFSSSPSVQLTSYRDTADAWITSCRVESVSNTSFVGQCNRVNTSSIGENSDVFISVSKQGADVNKSATIVGKFENINDTPTAKVIATRSADVNVSSGGLGYRIDFNTIVEDNEQSITVGANWEYRAKRDMTLKLSGIIGFNQNTQFNGTTERVLITLYKNGAVYRPDPSTVSEVIGNEVPPSGATTRYIPFNGTIELSENDYFYIAFAQESGGSVSLTNASLFVEEVPNLNAIIKNLSNQKVECQTKYLSAGVSSTGIISDLTFNNLAVGAKYKINGKIDTTRISTAISLNQFEMTISNGITLLEKTLIRSGNTSDFVSNAYPSKSFTASDTVLTFNATLLTNITIPDAQDRTYIELCELPDTYVETTKF